MSGMEEGFPHGEHAGEGECYRRALAYLMDVHPDEIAWRKPNEFGFWQHYTGEVRRLGWDFARYERPTWDCQGALAWKDAEIPSGRWLGVVSNAGGGGTHAVVFEGEKMIFQGQHRKRHPNKLHAIIQLEKR